MTEQTFTPADDVGAIVQMFSSELVDPTAPFTLVARLRFQPGAGERAARAFVAARTPTLAERGCLAFEMHRHAKDGTSCVIYERWQSIADLDRHLRQPHVVALRAAFEDLLAEPPMFTVLVLAAGA